jgi:hypothetical protein
MDVIEATQTTAFALPKWSAAEFLDMPYVDGWCCARSYAAWRPENGSGAS